jgi:tetratricopeptide (TPR) repeat protein
LPHEIVFLDNGSSVEKSEWLKAQAGTHSNLKIIENQDDHGQGQGCNLGITKSAGEHIVILSDQVIVTEGWLSGLLECLHSAPDAGLVGPMTGAVEGLQTVVQDESSSLETLDDYASSFRKRHRYQRIPTRSLSPICLLLERRIFDLVGLFDEALSGTGAEFEDYCHRILMEGFKIYISGDVYVHHGGQPNVINTKKVWEKWFGIDAQTEPGKKLARLNALEDSNRFSQKGLVDQAVGALIEGIKYCLEEKAIYWALAEILIDSGRYGEGLEALNSLPAESKDDPRSLVLFGYCRQGLGDLEGAQRDGQGALDLKTDDPGALNLLGVIARQRGDLVSATEYFRKAIVADPGYGEPYSNLGVLYWHGGEQEKALEFLEKGCLLSPLVSEGLALYQTAINELGRFEQAEKVLKSVTALYPLSKKLSFSLISILLAQGKDQEAMKEIERAMLAFGIDDGILTAALEVRDKIGPLKIDPQKKGGTLSVCMIVRNEEEHLPRCLMSLKPVADELIIVDTGSTDRTKEIARAFGARVYDFKWTNNFSEARNYSLSKATGHWILVHDADEVISALDYPKLRRIIHQKSAHSLAYVLTTRNYSTNSSLDGWTASTGEYPKEETTIGWFPTPKVRLYTNNAPIRFTNPVHELLEPSLIKAGFKLAPLDIPIHHYGELNLEKDWAKAETYYELGKKKLAESPDNPNALRELAIQAGELKRYEEAVELFEKYLLVEPQSHTAYFNLATCYLELEQFPKAYEAGQKAKELAPHSNEALLSYAGASLCLGKIAEGIGALEELLKRSPEYPVAKTALAAGYCLGGQKDKGSEILKALWKRGYDCSAALHSLSKKLVAAGQAEQAIALLRMMIVTKHIQPDTRDLLSHLEKTGFHTS